MTRYESTWSIATNHRHASDEEARLFYETFEKYNNDKFSQFPSIERKERHWYQEIKANGIYDLLS